MEKSKISEYDLIVADGRLTEVLDSLFFNINQCRKWHINFKTVEKMIGSLSEDLWLLHANADVTAQLAKQGKPIH